MARTKRMKTNASTFGFSLFTTLCQHLSTASQDMNENKTKVASEPASSSSHSSRRKDLLPRPLQGIIPPMITPLRGRDELDAPGLERLIEHILAGGVHGLFILGTSGEAPSLSYRLRRELIDRVCRHVAGRVPVLVGITDTAIVELLNLSRHAGNGSAQAFLLSGAYY